MTELVACLSTGKGTWGHVNRLITDQQWENVFLITNEFGKENFTAEKPVNFLVVNPEKGLAELKSDILEKLKANVKGAEVALNMVSGTGKEHMALISALLSLGVGIRLTALTKDGVNEL